MKCIDAPDDTKTVKGFENFLARYQDALKVSLNTDMFTRLGDKDQKALLAKLVLPSRYDFPQDKIEAVNALLDTAIDFNAEPFTVIELAYKQLYKQRENINRDVKNFVIPDALPIPKGVDSESLQKDLTSIRAEREKLQKERDAAVAKANEIEVKRATLQTKIEGLRADIDKGKTKLSVLDTCIQTDERVKRLTEVAGKAGELQKLQDDHEGYLRAIRTTTQQIERLRGIQDQGAACPTCDQTIDGVKVAGLIEELEKESAAADAELQILDTKIEAIGNIEAAKEILKNHEQAVKEKAELTKTLTDTVAEGKKTRTALDALTEKQDATLQFNDPLGSLQAKEDKILRTIETSDYSRG